MRFSKKTLLQPWLMLVLAGTVAIIGYVIFRNFAPQAASSPGFAIVNDSERKLSFNMSNNFKAIPKAALAIFNSNALYGFQAINDKDAWCVITQTKISSPRKVTAGYLRDGTFSTIKKNHPNARLDKATTIRAGSAPGVLLEISYEDMASSIKRAEVAALSKSSIIFAYCQSLAADSAKYYNDFTIFFSSLRIVQ